MSIPGLFVAQRSNAHLSGCSLGIVSPEDKVVPDTVMLCIQGGASLAIQVFFVFSGKPWRSDCGRAGPDSETDSAGVQQFDTRLKNAIKKQ